jgi:hypothetical protein
LIILITSKIIPPSPQLGNLPKPQANKLSPEPTKSFVGKTRNCASPLRLNSLLAKKISASGHAITTEFFVHPKNISASGFAMTSEFCIWTKNASTDLCVIATEFFVHPKNGSASGHAMITELYVELSLPQQTAVPPALQ